MESKELPLIESHKDSDATLGQVTDVWEGPNESMYFSADWDLSTNGHRLVSSMIQLIYSQ